MIWRGFSMMRPLPSIGAGTWMDRRRPLWLRDGRLGEKEAGERRESSNWAARSAFQLKLRSTWSSAPFFSQSPAPQLLAKRCVTRSFFMAEQSDFKTRFFQAYALRSIQAMAYLFASNSHMLCCECGPGPQLNYIICNARKILTTDCKREAGCSTNRAP